MLSIGVKSFCSDCCAPGGGRRGRKGWLFPGRDPVQPLTTQQLNRDCHAAAQMAEIGKRPESGGSTAVMVAGRYHFGGLC